MLARHILKMPDIDRHERAWKAAWLILAAFAVPTAFWIQFVGVCYAFVIGPIAYYGSTIIATSLIAFSAWVIACHGHRDSDDDDRDEPSTAVTRSCIFPGPR